MGFFKPKNNNGMGSGSGSQIVEENGKIIVKHPLPLRIENGEVYLASDNDGNADIVFENKQIFARQVI
ncbi:hypothetical protein P8825_14650 [Shouchella clausii]|uniref:hypothetical protein n=1 Tax=Shouchella clausii TaxID=79880 RepID=UPI002DB93832|nr:hypothetical protein [Shouchella clausii]MEB5480804.1 hypothetical protein [Shouchella clausii]